jgi:serine/threonine protein kinase
VIHAQALIGTVLGTVTLQKVVGQGELGVVFLAQQSPSHPQVAVKVLSPAAIRVPDQRTAFLERFCQEINVIPSLEHQNIVPVLEHGKHDGMAYLMMPYISDGTLLRAIEQQGQLPLLTVADYLDQLANALDYAHKHGILHLDLKPNNVFLTATGRLLLTDFGLMKIVAERQTSQMRLLRAGTPVGSLEFMAPEQVMGDVVDARTDLYALGVMLYQMVTGKTPFREGTSLQIATQLLQAPPPSPRLMRNDLPQAAEKVMLQALAKRPLDRHATAQDLARAFRAALPVAGSLGERPASTISNTVNPAAAPLSVSRKRGLFDPVWQQPSLAPTSSELLRAASEASFQPGVQLPFAVSEHQRNELAAPVFRAPETPLPSTRPGLKARGLLPMDGTRSTGMPPAGKTTTGADTSMTTGELPRSSFAPWQSASVAPQQFSSSALPGLAPNLTRPLPLSNGQQPTTGALPITQPVSPLPATSATGGLLVPSDESGANKTMKLTEAVKVVQMPVAGQPGRYVTGFLPMLPRTEQPEESTSKPKNELSPPDYVKLLKWFVVPLLVLLIVTSSGIFFYLHTRPPITKSKSDVGTESLKPDWQAIKALQATATANANYILSDSLQQNIHNWPIVATGNKTYLFKNGAYHVTDNDGRQSAATLLPDVILNRPLVYSLTMEEIQGDDSSINNSFGMIFFLNSQVKNGKTVVTFYSFEAANTKGGNYQFLKYDSSKGQNPYTTIWQHGFGGEFHQGKGVRNSNTFKVTNNGKSFTFWVNGKKVGTAEDNSISRGQVGMLVNLKGTEVAFSNLQLMYN